MKYASVWGILMLVMLRAVVGSANTDVPHPVMVIDAVVVTAKANDSTSGWPFSGPS